MSLFGSWPTGQRKACDDFHCRPYLLKSIYHLISNSRIVMPQWLCPPPPTSPQWPNEFPDTFEIKLFKATSASIIGILMNTIRTTPNLDTLNLEGFFKRFLCCTSFCLITTLTAADDFCFRVVHWIFTRIIFMMYIYVHRHIFFLKYICSLEFMFL